MAELSEARVWSGPMSFPPPRPKLPATHCADGPLSTRYEDIAQDGRIHLATLPDALSGLVWSRLLADHAITKLARAHGVLPILTKLALEGSDETLPATRPLEGKGAFDLAHAGDGDSRRLILRIWIDLHGERGRTHLPPPPGAGERVLAGRVYGEHVFTRPFAPRDDRRVTRFEFPGLPEVPAARHDYQPAQALAELPAGATWLDDDLVADPAPIVFGLAHTDSNQHVNSLVYPRLFEESVLRRLADLGRPVRSLLMRRAEMGYRRPCFSGERVRIHLRLYERGDRVGAVGHVAADGAPENEPARCYLRAELG